jgi:ComF family protein
VPLLDLLLPRRCLVCHDPGADLCESCLRRVPRIATPLCDRCGAPTAWPVSRCRECAGRRLAFASARAAVAYDAGVRALVAGWKERGLRGVARTAADIVVEVVAAPTVDALTFVPADAEREFKRGHHPAAALAQALGDRWELPVVTALERTRTTRRQTGLPFAERKRNVAGAFGPTGDAPRSTALVDDVYTTGSTVAAASTALRRAGARRVEVITFARAIR